MKRNTTIRANVLAGRSLPTPTRSIGMSVAFTVTTLCLLMRPESTHAETAVWIGPAIGGDFQTPANWSIAAEPTIADLALFGGVDGTITYSADAATGQTFFTGANATTTLGLGAGQTHSTTALFLVGSGGVDQDVVVPSGTVNTGSILIIGSGLGSNDSDVTISGPNTVFRTGQTSDSASVFIGTGGLNPTLTIKEGATFIYNKPSSGLVGVGLQQTSNGLLTVTDPGSSLSTTGALQVGSNNDPGNADMFNNQVKVLNAATLTANRVQVGILESGKQNTVTVSGPDSKMNLTGEGAEAPIGWRSINNTLFVDKGGLIDGGNSFVLGIESTSTGNAATIASGGRVNGTGFEVRRGTLTISEGSLYLRQFFDSLNMIYTGGAFVSNVGSNGFVDFNSGTVEAVSAEFNKALTVGDGGGISATYHMVKDATGANGTHSFSGGLVLSSNAILEGSGNIAGGVSGSPGARVVVGTSPGLINALNDWSNIGLAVDLEVGDFRSLPAVAGVGYDQLDVVGSFTHGGSLAIDVSSYINGSGPLMDLKLVGWGSQIGNSADTAVAFIGGPALAYEFRADGFYLTDVAVVPEPATVVLLAGCLGIGFLRRPRIAVTN